MTKRIRTFRFGASTPSALASGVLCLGLLSACSMQYTPPGQVAPEDMDDYQRVNAQGASVGLICKREPVVGTRLSKRTCSTAAQREAAREQARIGLEEVQRKATAPSIQE